MHCLFVSLFVHSILLIGKAIRKKICIKKQKDIYIYIMQNEMDKMFMYILLADRFSIILNLDE